MILSVDFSGPAFHLNEGQKIHREIHSKIHNTIPAKSTHVVNNGDGKSTLQEEGPEICTGFTGDFAERCIYESTLVGQTKLLS